ncbi:MAG: glycosyltransferase family 2 protein [Algoriphagus aquaeductus]|uniref:glycosyltransferase family 2 protein n=1 Tax=Algoriphagus aquaeductus TaxID=475299 RepID=UPI003879E2CD
MISVIVPNYNHLQFLPKRLETVFSQTFQDFEVILLDDCSTDNSWELLKQYENHPKVSHCIRNQVNSGSPFKQWKKGLDLAKFDWIWIAESDDFSALDFLERMVKYVEVGVHLIFCSSNEVNENGNLFIPSEEKFPIEGEKFLESSFKMDGKSFVHKWLRYKNYIDNASSAIFFNPRFFPKESLEMRYSGDWYFWIYLLSMRGNVVHISYKLNFFRYHSSTTRVFIDVFKEFEKKIERFSCIQFAHRCIGFKSIFDVMFYQYDYDVKDFFHLNSKFGRFRLRGFFPRIPFFLYPKYYKHFLKSIFE